MFDPDALLTSCQEAVGEADPRLAVRDVLDRVLERQGGVAEVLGRPNGGIEVLYNSASLTVLNVVWAPKMSIYPHEHRMWAAIGIYGGAEDNTLFRRTQQGIAKSGVRELRERDVFLLGAEAIHSVHNPVKRFTGAIHVYGGDFLNQPRSQWDPDTLVEEPYDRARVVEVFEQANAAWTAQSQREAEAESFD